MLTVLLLFVGFGTASQAMPVPEEGPPTLIVQVVDPVWIPLPVKPASGKGPSKSAHGDDNGNAQSELIPASSKSACRGRTERGTRELGSPLEKRRGHRLKSSSSLLGTSKR